LLAILIFFGICSVLNRFPAAGQPHKDGRLHHYIFFNLERERISEPDFLETKSIEGAQLKYTWKELEKQKDAYDFSAVEKDLDFLKKHGKRLFIQVQDVTFDPRKNCVPAYLTSQPEYSGGVAVQYADDGKTIDGYIARRWDRAVQQRFQKLIEALGKRFDGEIEGINLPETASDVIRPGKTSPKGFSPAVYRDSILANMATLKQAFPKSASIQYANFMPGEWLPEDDHSYLQSVFDRAAKLGVGVGGPDLFPYKKSQMKHCYKLMHEWKGTAPTGIAVQDGNYAYTNPQTKKKVTVKEQIDFARDYLHATYVFWCTEAPYYRRDLIPALRLLDSLPTADRNVSH
jgi:hypothetical protein